MCRISGESKMQKWNLKKRIKNSKTEKNIEKSMLCGIVIAIAYSVK